MSRPRSDTSPPQPVPSDEVVVAERMVAGGEALAHLADGRVAFVPGAFVGDRLRLQSVTPHGGYVRAERWSLEQGCDERRQPPCPVAERCGGCDWMGIDESTQKRLAAQLVSDAFRRVGKFDPPPELGHVHPSQPLGYRNRVRLHLSEDGKLGYLARNSNQHVAIEACPVCTPQLNEAIAELTKSMREHGQRIARVIEQMELRCLGPMPELLLFQRQGSSPARLDEWLSQVRSLFHVAWAGAKSTPSPQPVSLAAGGSQVEVRIAPGVFSQVNWQINQALVHELVSGAQSRQLRSFADLYCGNGNFSLPLLARGMSGVGVEGNAQSIRCAQQAAAAQNLAAQFEVGSVEKVARRWADEGRLFDLVVLDPPRAGARRALSSVMRLATDWVFYCACDPVSLARDARALCQRGFALREVKLFDMFPQTHHIESVAWLQKTKPT